MVSVCGYRTWSLFVATEHGLCFRFQHAVRTSSAEDEKSPDKHEERLEVTDAVMRVMKTRAVCGLLSKIDSLSIEQKIPPLILF